MSARLLVKNWRVFQHYKDRSPPWIKLQKSLLDDYEFACLPVASKALAPMLWLLASESDDGSVPADTAHLAFRLRWPEKDILAGLKPLIQKGFLVDASNTLADCKQSATSEAEAEVETEAEAEAERARVFDHWKKVHGHPQAKLDGKRGRVIREALKVYTADELCEAISGYRNSPHHMGQNDRNTVYDGIELLLRDAKHIDAGLKFARDPPRSLSKLTRQNISNTEAWLPPEVRSASQGQGSVLRRDERHGEGLRAGD